VLVPAFAIMLPLRSSTRAIALSSRGTVVALSVTV
jgi:hypothetical protein